MSNIHLLTSYLPEGIHTHTHKLSGKKKNTTILYAEEKSSSQSAATSSTRRRESFYSAEVEEGLSGKCDELLPTSAFPRWGRNSVMQPGPKATTHEDQSLSSCQILNWVLHFIYFK